MNEIKLAVIKKYVTLLCNFMLIIVYNTPGMFYRYRMKIPKYYHASKTLLTGLVL